MGTAAPPVKLSVITPVYQAAVFIEEFCKRMGKAASAITPDYEIICVNDASTDNSLEILKRLAAADPRIVVIDKPKNEGQIQALVSGLRAARGERIFTIDDDLDEDPEWLATFWKTMDEKHKEIVFGAQMSRSGSLFTRLSGRAIFFIMNTLWRSRIIENVMSARLMTRKAVDAIIAGRTDIPYCLMCYLTKLPYTVILLEKSSHTGTSYTVPKRFAFVVLYFKSYWQHHSKLGPLE